VKMREAVELHSRQSGRTAVFVRKEGALFVAEFEGQTVNAATCWALDTKLDGIAPQPRNLYLIDEED